MSADALRWDAAAKEQLATRIEAEARTLPDMLDGVAARIGPDVWRGPAAEQFEAGVRRWRATLDGEASALLGVARRLRARADQLRSEAARVEAAERAAAAERRAEAARRAERAVARTGGGIG